MTWVVENTATGEVLSRVSTERGWRVVSFPNERDAREVADSLNGSLGAEWTVELQRDV